jgi:hypothetical protein
MGTGSFRDFPSCEKMRNTLSIGLTACLQAQEEPVAGNRQFADSIFVFDRGCLSGAQVPNTTARCNFSSGAISDHQPR